MRFYFKLFCLSLSALEKQGSANILGLSSSITIHWHEHSHVSSLSSPPSSPRVFHLLSICCFTHSHLYCSLIGSLRAPQSLHDDFPCSKTQLTHPFHGEGKKFHSKSLPRFASSLERAVLP